MSIWGSDDGLARAGEPYLDEMAGAFYAVGAEALASLPRGGYVDFATAPGFVDLVRLTVALDGERMSDEVLLFLGEEHVRAIVAAGTRWLEALAADRARSGS